MPAQTKRSAPVPQLVVEDLARSGLRFEDHSQYLFAFNPHPAPLQLTKAFPSIGFDDKNAVLLFQYHRFADDWSLIPIPTHEFARARMYWKELSGFAAQTGKDDRPKYLQRSGTPVHVYIPPMLDWKAFGADKDKSLVIVEGEKKALAMAMRGVYCIGLGGVTSIAPGKHATLDERAFSLIPDLARAVEGRRFGVFIAFDVDSGHTAMKSEVAKAALKLAHLVTEKSALARIVTFRRGDLPITEKLGADDWLLHHTKRDDALLEMLLEESETDATSQALLALNSEYIYVVEGNYVGDTGRYLHSVQGFKEAQNNQKIPITTKIITRQGMVGTKLEMLPRGTAWMQWIARQTAKRPGLMPGNPALLTEDGTYNTWRGWAQLVPKARVVFKDVKPFLDALHWLHSDPDCVHMLQWYLYPLAYPEDGKQFVIPIMQSGAEGVGKSRIPELIGKYVYGHHYAMLNEKSLNNDRFEFAAESLFVLCDDVKSLKMQQAILNHLATGDTLHINEKYIRSRQVRNMMNIVVTTNQAEPLRMTAEMRRYFMPHINDEKNEKMWDDLSKWFENENGGGKLIRFAQQMREENAFEQLSYKKRMEAPRNAKREEMEELGANEAETWVKQHMHASKRDIVTFAEAYAQFRVYGIKADLPEYKYSKAALQSAINTVGTHQMRFAKKQIRTTLNGKTETAMGYAVRNVEKWRGRIESSWRDELHRVTKAY